MGNLFSQKCDLCGKVQTEEDAHKIKGTSFSMSGATQFACGECKDILHAAFSVGAGGLREPMLELAKVVKERDQLKRLLTQSRVQREEGTVALAGVEYDHMRMQQTPPSERFRAADSVLGQFVPVRQGHRIGQAPGQGAAPPENRLEDKTTKKAEPPKAPEKAKGIMGRLGLKKKK